MFKKNLAWSRLNSFNHVKEKQMLSLDVEFQNFAIDTKQILGFMILKVEGYSLRMVNRRTYVYTFIKIVVVFVLLFEEKIDEIVYLRGRRDRKRFQIC